MPSGAPPARFAGARWLVAAVATIAVLGLITGCAVADSEPGPAVSAADPTGPCTVPTGTTDDFPNAGMPRIVRAEVPPGADSQTPLVIALHSGLGTGSGLAKQTGLSSLARRDGVMIVYPSKADGPGVWEPTPGSADVAFIGDLVDYLHAHGCGSPKTTTLMGFSAGAMLGSLVACERPGGIGALMMVAGVLPPEQPCGVLPSLTVVAVHGTADPTVRFDGVVTPVVAALTGRDSDPITRAEMVREWSIEKGCAAAPRELMRNQLLVTSYVCPQVAPSTMVTVVGGRHEWRMGINWDTSSFLWSQLPKK